MMSERQGKAQQGQASISTPSLSWRQRIFGDPLSTGNAEAWPELAKSWAGRQHEMPNEARGVGKLKPMNWLERKIYGPTVQGITYPWGTIALNRENVEANKVNLDDLLVHEMTHIGQKQKGGILGMFSKGGSMDMPDYEQEAFEAANNRYKKNRLTDIRLPNTPTTTTPTTTTPTISGPSDTTRNKILATRHK